MTKMSLLLLKGALPLKPGVSLPLSMKLLVCKKLLFVSKFFLYWSTGSAKNTLMGDFILKLGAIYG